jgi:topoisomerase IV subunit A
LAYALSTIMSRSLPDVRDGLKPVHRRLLYAMMQLRLDPKSGYKKCARVIGDVIGKYHPHGEAALYDTLVRLAQNFTLRYPLVDGQGNFGSIDGDNAAAMRYTESRLTNIALALLKDIDKDTVIFKPTYDEQEHEPTVLPASFPNILANGAEGIAVGMATSIPPHNLGELCDALLLLLDKPSSSLEEIMEIVQGPDFPTGSIIYETKDSIITSYKTGRGSFKIRAKWHKQELSHGLYQIIITEIPYQVQKSKLIEKIANLYKDKKLTLLGNIIDESTEDIRIILEPKSRLCDADLLMESMFKLTDLEIRYNLNMNVLDSKSIPRVMSIKEILESFLIYRNEIILKRSQYELEKIERRLEILDGLLIAYLNLDKIIEIIRYEDEPKKILGSTFNLTDNQAEAILNMKLRNLRKLEEMEIKTEHQLLSKEKDHLLLVIQDENKRKKLIATDIKLIKEQFGKNTEIGKRRTEIKEPNPENSVVLNIEALIEKEPVTIICSKKGWIRCIKGHNVDTSTIKYKDGDEEGFVVKALTTDKIILFSKSGKFFTIIADHIQRGKGNGDSVNVLFELEDNDTIINLFAYRGTTKLLLCSKLGKAFITDEENVVAQTKSGKKILNLAEKDEAYICKVVEGDSIAVIGTNRKLLIFSLAEIPEMKRGMGVTLQKYQNAQISDIKLFNFQDGLSWSLGDRTRLETNLTPWKGKRAQAGKIPPMGFPRNNKF